MKMKMGFVERRLQMSPNVYGRKIGVTSPKFTMEQGLAVPLRSITKAGVGKYGAVKPKNGALLDRAITSRPVVQGMDTQGKVLKKAKKYWMWIVAALVGYFLFARK